MKEARKEVYHVKNYAHQNILYTVEEDVEERKLFVDRKSLPD